MSGVVSICQADLMCLGALIESVKMVMAGVACEVQRSCLFTSLVALRPAFANHVMQGCDIGIGS